LLTFQFLDMVDGLTRLDPVRTYPARAGELIARLCRADGFRLVLADGETAESATPFNSEGPVVKLPIRYGRQTLGSLEMALPEGRDKLEASDLRVARWAARVVGRCLSYSARMRTEGGRKASNEELAETLSKAPLTPRERDVVALLMAGSSTREIASDTGLTVGTVHTYLKRIYPKLGVRSRVELVAKMAGTDAFTLQPPPTAESTQIAAVPLPPAPVIPVISEG